MTLCICGHGKELHFNTHCWHENDEPIFSLDCDCKKFTPQTSNSQERNEDNLSKAKIELFPMATSHVEKAESTSRNKKETATPDTSNFFARRLKEIEKEIEDNAKIIGNNRYNYLMNKDYNSEEWDNAIQRNELLKAQKQILLECMDAVRKAIDEVHVLKDDQTAMAGYCHTCDVLHEIKSKLGISEEDSDKIKYENGQPEDYQ